MPRLAPTLVTVAVLLVVLAAAVAEVAAAPSRKVHVTFVGDSVSASIGYVPAARRELRGGLVVRLDVAVCRRLVTASCTYQGSTPLSALQAWNAFSRGKPWFGADGLHLTPQGAEAMARFLRPYVVRIAGRG